MTIKKVSFLLLLATITSCNSHSQEKKEDKIFPLTKTEAEWRQELSEIEFYVLREEGTERAFTSELNSNYKEGIYVCAACKVPLFKSEHKFDSGTGWPSFDRAIEGAVEYSVDYKLGYGRTEQHCANCGGHLGHVFGDGPRKTTGKRHCINGIALNFIPNNE